MNVPAIKKESPLSLQVSEQELMEVLRNSLYPGSKDASIKMVIAYCKASGLDPMQKPVHIVPMWDKNAGTMRDVIMPGIGLYRTQAARSGVCAGVSEPEFGPDTTETIGGLQITYPAWCRVTTNRRLPTGEIVSFTAKEFWKENYAVQGGKDKSIAPNSMWTRRPYAQLAKCCEAQALRKAFPEFGAHPTAEEMEGRILDDDSSIIDGTTGEVVNKKEEQKTLPIYTDAQMEENLPFWQRGINSGKTTPDRIITMVRTKYRLTDEQVKRIKALKKQKDAKPVDIEAAVANVVDADFVAAMEAEENKDTK